jgi:uncharacterized protein (DUF2384 family)
MLPNVQIEDSPLFDKRQYQRQYNASEQGKNVRKKYRHDNSKHATDAAYLSRPIVAIDGEGVNIRRGLRKGEHLYVMLAISNVPPIVNKEGLRTGDVLEYLFTNLSSKNINVIYGGSYDFNCWLKDLLEDELRAVYNSSYTSSPIWYGQYGIRWIKGKAFEITDGEKTVTINDVISFFQRPFVQACDEYLGTEWIGRDVIIAEKKRRGNFTLDELENVGAYNQLELDRLVDLVSELRKRLNKVGLRPRRWNSPGAIASALFQRERVKKHRNEELPEEVMRAARFAYAGGRFEMIKYGAVRSRVYEYDINSAYPRALLDVPSLIGGRWEYHTDIHPQTPVFPYALYRVRYQGTRADIPGPLFMRGRNGTISYPLNVETWIWSPEYETLQEYCRKIDGATYELLEVWEYQPSSDYKPFHFIEKLYKKRQALKAAGDGAHIGIKLALNSLYGKLAQQVGYIMASKTHPARVPTYHQLEWAGYTTSWCRANVLRAALLDIGAVIAFETDALFSSRPLPVTIGTGLGDWEETRFRSLTYVQSGHYYATKTDGESVIKCRGIDKGFISRKAVEDALRKPESERVLEAKLTRFYGAGIALARGLSQYWRKWLTEPKVMQLTPTGKRLHGNCVCQPGEPLEFDYWHSTYCPIAGGVSHEYPVEWINPNPEMSELSEFREAENYFGD